MEQTNMKYSDFTEAEFDYELRDFHRAAYGQYVAFVDERRKRKAAFEEAQQNRCAVSRWFHKQIQDWRDACDDETEEELLGDANPLAGFALYKQHHPNKK